MQHLEDKIKNNNYPLLCLYSIFCNNNISDDNKSYVVKFFFKHHMNLAIEYNLLKFKDILKDNPSTYNTIYDIYYIISQQISLLKYLSTFKKMYPNKMFWRKNILEQIVDLKILYTKFLSLFDGSKGCLYFHVKLKAVEKENQYHIDEILDRLKLTYSMFKSSFFEINKIIILDSNQFMDLKFSNMIKYTEYIFLKINSILKEYISYFELYEYYRVRLYNILNTMHFIDIDINETNSDIDDDDLPLLIIKY